MYKAGSLLRVTSPRCAIVAKSKPKAEFAGIDYTDRFAKDTFVIFLRIDKNHFIEWAVLLIDGKTYYDNIESLKADYKLFDNNGSK